MRVFILGCLLVLTSLVQAQEQPENIVLITIDGLRWQEVFRGLDARLAMNEEYSERSEQINLLFSDDDSAISASKLMPFLHEVVFEQGSVYGNRDMGSCAKVTNPWFFSYPGYNEILTGAADPAIDSNAAVNNPNISFMEWLQNEVPDYRDNVAAFASWDVFPYILNTDRSGIPVNIGKLEHPENSFESMLNRLHDEIPSPWPTVRLDAFTHHYALSYMQNHHPKVTYIAYGETDDFAHDGEYDQYVLAANKVDKFIREIWTFIQSDRFYRNNTAILISVDHGRGESPLETWQHHASKASLQGYMEALDQYEDGIVGSDAVWIAALGKGVTGKQMINTGAGCVGSNQIAATILTLLGLDYQSFNPAAGEPLYQMLERQ